MVKHQVFQKISLLSEEDFSSVVKHKDIVFKQAKGAIFIHKDGSATIDDSLKDGVQKEHPEFHDYKISKNIVFNLNQDIDHFLPYFGEPFIKLMTAIQNALIDFGVNNPKPTDARIYRNNNTVGWHKHFTPKTFKHTQAWTSIFYMHPNWDTKYEGNLHVSIIENEKLFEFPCYSNSVVAHNGYYGHSVEKLILGFEGNRDIFLVHWLSD